MLKDIRLKLKEVVLSPNLSEKLGKEELDELGLRAVEQFDRDQASRSDWLKRNDTSLNLALQVAELKTFPWPDAANVKFPLLTIAAVQYHSRAYPALINGPTPVDCRIMANAPTAPQLPPPPPQAQGQQQGQQPPPEVQKWQQQVQQIKQKAMQETMQYGAAKERAARVAGHMSYQILEEDEQWEEQMDKLLLIQAISGCAFKKTYFDPVTGHNVSECLSPRDLVVNYYTKSLETSPCVTHIIPMFKNDLRERVVRGVFNEMEGGDDLVPPSPTPYAMDSRQADERQGVVAQTGDPNTPYLILEQHCLLDLDGDGYAEPYIVTVRYDTKQVLRIVARFTSVDINYAPDSTDIVRINPIQIFTKYPFIPSPDGGFYDLGFGSLLGPINESIDTAINQLLDAGSLSNAGGGFLGRGFKGKSGDLRFRLAEWKRVDCTGDDLRKNIFPLPTKEPSAVLFNLLSLLIQYGQQVAGATDIMQGESPGQNTPAETSRNTLEQGMKVFNGIYKRTHRSFTQELRKMFKLNQIYLADESKYYAPGAKSSSKILNADYGGTADMVRPAADPFYMSDSQRMNQATAVLQLASTVPGMDTYVAAKRYLTAWKVDNIDELLPDPKGPNAIPPKPDPKMELEKMKLQSKEMDGKIKLQIVQMELAAEAQKIQAEIKLLEAQAIKELADAKGVESGHAIAMLEAQIGAKKAHMEGISKVLKVMQDHAGNLMDNQEANAQTQMQASKPTGGSEQ
jgi:chaperonin GroES